MRGILRKNCLLELFIYNMMFCIKYCKILNCNIHRKIEFLGVV